MDDSDLAHNFKKLRNRYWIRHNLWIPADITCTFEKIRRTRNEVSKGVRRPLASCDIEDRKIRLIPESAYFYMAAHINLLHEMAHLYIGEATNWDERYFGHGKRFKAEIDRLYALGAFRTLI